MRRYIANAWPRCSAGDRLPSRRYRAFRRAGMLVGIIDHGRHEQVGAAAVSWPVVVLRAVHRLRGRDRVAAVGVSGCQTGWAHGGHGCGAGFAAGRSIGAGSIRHTVDKADRPSTSGVFAVMKTADQGCVVEVSGAAVGPRDHVVGFAPAGRAVAAGEGAAPVPGGQRMSLGGAGDPASPAEVKDGPARVEDGRICASAARRSAAGMDKLPPWLVVTSPVRASSSSTAMVSSTVAGVPPASGRLPERRSRRPAFSSASCRRCPGVRVSGSPSSAGTGRLSCREPWSTPRLPRR